MDNSKLFMLTLFICLRLTLSQQSTAVTITIEPQDLDMPLGSDSSFKVLSSTGVNKTLRLILVEENPSQILLWNPDSVGIRDLPKQVKVSALNPGRAVVYAKIKNESILKADEDIDIKEAFIRIDVYRYSQLNIFNAIIGWAYALCSAFSFYPQIWQNFRRKSVVGLDFDYCALNLHGFAFYTVFNAVLFWSPEVKAEYLDLHPHGVIPIQPNDIAFALHGAFAAAIVIIQIFIYERSDQKLSKLGIGILVLIYACLIVGMVLSFCSVITWLTYIYVYSYVKLGVTLVKYVPQVYLNFRRRSTSGWSVGNVLLDYSSAVCCLTQMFLIAYNYNDWGSIIPGNISKLGICVFTIFFDTIFTLQHFLLYRHSGEKSKLIQ